MTLLIGGEMPAWSDLDGTHGPAPAGGPALRQLLAAVTGRTLVAGPHDRALIDAIPAADVTVLVRGVADAEALTAHYAGRPGVTICCGSLEKLAAVPAYDTVLALDGLDRLCSPEAADASWDETFARLLTVLHPAGRLLLACENLFGLHRLLTLPADPADTAWTPADDHDPARPRTLAHLRTRLAEAGLPVIRDYAVYPAPDRPTVLLSEEPLADPALRGYLEATLAATQFAPPTAGDGAAAPGVDEPAVSGVGDRAEGGSATLTGAGHRGASGAGRAPIADPVRLVTGALRHDLAVELAPAWILQAGGGAAGPVAVVGDAILRRDAAGRWEGASGRAVPLGRTLSGLLLAACQRRALPVVRELLTAWQGSAAAGVPADRVVVDDAAELHPLGRAGEPVRALRGFAAMAIAGGYAHLWPAPADEAELTALLAGMTGRELDPASVPAADPSAARPWAAAVRELTMARDRLERELAEARARHEFYERTIVHRDAELKRVRLVNAVLAATAPGRAATSGMRAARAAFRRIRGG
jgi:hypothetical protein